MRLRLIICLLLAGVTLGIYWPTRHFEILYYDDPYFVLAPGTALGLSWAGLNWAMTVALNGNWHPLTTLSFLMVHQWFGVNPGAEHLVNVMVHTANGVLLFLLLMRLTGRPGRSAVVAAIFAWHPQRVESVAWIAERKDVLFMFFLLVSLWFYTNYARARSAEIAAAAGKRVPGFTPWNINYILALVFFILSFLSKAMVVTLPFLLLLLDFWPLKRMASMGKAGEPIRELLVEKIPFFALTIYISVVTYNIQAQNAAVASLGEYGLAGRWENAALSYVQYWGDFFWPTKLALLYPHPTGFDGVQVVLAGLLLMAITAGCLMEWSRRPYLAVGWFWYLGTMVPVIGLVQIGEAAMADRYTYLPMIGPVVSLVWLGAEWAGTKTTRRFLARGAVAAGLAACVLLSRRQVMFWQNTVTVFTRTAAVTANNGMAQFPLAQGLQYQGRLREAAVHYRMAIEMKPDGFHFLAHWNYAGCLGELGCFPEDERQLDMALQLEPDSVMALNNLTWLLATCPEATVRNGARAVDLGERLCQLTGYQQTLYVGTLAAAYAEAGRFDEAIATSQHAIALAQESGDGTLAANNQGLLQVYLARRAYHEAWPAPRAN